MRALPIPQPRDDRSSSCLMDLPCDIKIDAKILISRARARAATCRDTRRESFIRLLMNTTGYLTLRLGVEQTEQFGLGFLRALLIFKYHRHPPPHRNESYACGNYFIDLLRYAHACDSSLVFSRDVENVFAGSQT